MAQKIDYELTEAEAALLMVVTREAMADAGALGASLAQGPFRDPLAERSGAAGGVVIEDPNAAGDGSIWGVVPSGALDMAPALVRVQVETTDSGGSRVQVRATGREGLIKQRIGAKAVDRICAAVLRTAGADV